MIGKRRLLACSIVSSAIVLSGSTALASELDPSGKLRSIAPGAKTIDLDRPSTIASAAGGQLLLTSWQVSGRDVQLVTSTPDPSKLAARIIADADAVQGQGALRLGIRGSDTTTGVLIPGAWLATIGPRIELTYWAKSEGGTPYLTAGWSTQKPFGSDFVELVALRTGRETSDGWAEFTTGTIDTEIWGVPLSGIHIAVSASLTSGGFLLDGIEVVPRPGTTVAPNACTQQNVDEVCGADGDCQYGHCMPGYAAWGPLPPRQHREQLVARWVHLARRIQGDRKAALDAAALEREGPALAWYATASRPFFAGVVRLVNQLRDQHTHFGSPSSALFYPLAHGGGSATIGACFGPGRHDLLAEPGSKGELGYIVYRANETPLSGVKLRRGDALTKIDGRPPRDWVRDVWGGLAGSLPNDPSADLGWSATGLAWLVEKRASTIELTRCKSETRCDGEYREVVQVDVAAPIYENIRGTGSIGKLEGYFGCGIRFKNSLDKFAPNVRGENTVSGQIVRTDVLAVQFDGTYGLEQWSPSMMALFPESAPPTKVLFDVRQGNGGYGFNAETVANLLRPRSQSIGNLILPIGAWDGVTLQSLMGATKICADRSSSSYLCSFSEVFFTNVDAPIAQNARVAFLQAADVSANDFLAKLVKGRSHLKIYGPGATSGAFGSVSSIPPFLVGWSGGSVQMQDSVFAPTWDEFADGPWESGRGVPPDVIAAEKMSDAIADRDTLIEAAHAWLAGGPEEGGEL